MRVDYGIANIPLFRVDVPLFSKRIWFGAKMTKIELDDKIELRKIFRPLCLSSGQYLGCRKILKVFIIHNNVDSIGQTVVTTTSLRTTNSILSKLIGKVFCRDYKRT